MRPQRCLSAAWVAIVVGTLPAAAQAWTAQLMLSPMPSPFVSDWEVDPSVAELIVTNGTATATAVTFHYTLARGSQIVLRGVTDAHTVGGSESKVFNASTTFGGKADWNRELQDIVARTGRLPEGEYQGCVALAGPGGVVLIERECATFTVGYPDPPFLVHPMNGDTVRSQAPMFEWQPVQLPAMADARVGYVLQVAEVNPATRQSPEVALSSNILHYVEPGLVETFHQYPVGGLPLVSGRTYAWRVQALDPTGKPIASNQGRSEIWTFVYREPESEAQRTVARVELSVSRDTLRFAGDTARYTAQAYDADNVEIAGKRVQWRALDTAVVRVDSTGVVTAARLGQTQIIAGIDGVLDSASSVVAARALAVRFETYDAANESPSLLELIRSGSFEDVVPALMARLEAGDFVIPIPRRPGAATPADPGDSMNDGARHERGSIGGPFVSSSAVASRHGRPASRDECSVTLRGVKASVNRERKVFAVLLDDPQTPNVLAQCAAVPPSQTQQDEEARDASDAAFNKSALFVVSWEHPGLPRAFIAFKGSGGLPLPFKGTHVRMRWVVVNLVRAVTVESDMLPATFAGFFGHESFDAGVGITLYAKRSCGNATLAVTRAEDQDEQVSEFNRENWLCLVLRAINPENPDITIQAFAGVTARESSVELSGGRRPSGAAGKSLALGFSIQASLPVRKNYRSDNAGFRIDSTQLGLLFSVQDSIVGSVEQSVEERQSRDTSIVSQDAAQNWSIGISPTLTIWLTGSRDRQWQVDGSIGVEWDPTKIGEKYGLAPKIVISGVLQATWMLGAVRLGSPQFVFTTPLGQLAGQREATTLAFSGAWGFGPPGEWGLMEDEGGAAPTDAGSARSSAAAGFEEIGRGQITLEWTRMTADSLAQENRRAAAGRDTVQAKQQRDSATARVTRKLHEYNAAKQRLDTAKARLALAKDNQRDAGRAARPATGTPGGLAPPTQAGPQQELAAATAEAEAAEKAAQSLQAEVQALRQARTDARDALRPRTCLANIKDRCVTWKASLSLESGALTDIAAAIARLVAGAVAGAIQ